MVDNQLHDMMSWAFLECMRWNREQLTVVFHYTLPKALESQIKIGGIVTLGSVQATVVKIHSHIPSKLFLNKHGELLAKAEWSTPDEKRLVEICDELKERDLLVEQITDGLAICVTFPVVDFINEIKNKSSRLVDEAKRAWQAYQLLKKYNLDEFFGVPSITYHDEPGVIQ